MNQLDILMVVHNGLEYLGPCVDSIFAHTKSFRLLIWDNASDIQTRSYLATLQAAHPEVTVTNGIENFGFILPNNLLARTAKAPFMCLLNSDTEVYPKWDTRMTDHLEANRNCKVVGYDGCNIGPDGKGIKGGTDYVEGWCMCLTRDTYQRFGLFDEQRFKFAYCEDADLCLRLREKGFTVKALTPPLVRHHGQKTMNEVRKHRDVEKYYDANHLQLRLAHAAFIAKRNHLDYALYYAKLMTEKANA